MSTNTKAQNDSLVGVRVHLGGWRERATPHSCSAIMM